MYFTATQEPRALKRSQDKLALIRGGALDGECERKAKAAATCKPKPSLRINKPNKILRRIFFVAICKISAQFNLRNFTSHSKWRKF